VTTSAGGSGGCAGGGGGGSGRDKTSREKIGGFSSSPTPMRSSRRLANKPPKNYKELSVSFGDNNGSFSDVGSPSPQLTILNPNHRPHPQPASQVH